MKRRMRLIVAVVALSALTSVAFAQCGFGRRFAPAPDQPLAGEPKEWTFARLAYDGGGYRGRGSWATDYPRAEYHFSQAVERLTRIDVHPDGHVLSPDTDDLFDYPWLYAVEVGYWALRRIAGGANARVSAARRLPHGRRLPRRGGVAGFHGRHARRSFPIGRSKTSRQTTRSTRSRMRSASASRYPDRTTWAQACSMNDTME